MHSPQQHLGMAKQRTVIPSAEIARVVKEQSFITQTIRFFARPYKVDISQATLHSSRCPYHSNWPLAKRVRRVRGLGQLLPTQLHQSPEGESKHVHSLPWHWGPTARARHQCHRSRPCASDCWTVPWRYRRCRWNTPIRSSS